MELNPKAQENDDQTEIKIIPKNALYLGLLLNEPLETINTIVIEGLRGILEAYPNIEDAKILLKEFEQVNFEKSEIFKTAWKYPKENKNWHLTTLFRKGSSFNKSHPAFLNFEDGKHIVANVRGIIYIPKRIMTSIVFVDTPVANEFPHITTLVGTFSPKHSNDLMHELFADGKCSHKEYKKLFKDELNDEPFVNVNEINILNKKEKAYVYKFQEMIKLDTTMKVFFN